MAKKTKDLDLELKNAKKQSKTVKTKKTVSNKKVDNMTKEEVSTKKQKSSIKNTSKTRKASTPEKKKSATKKTSTPEKKKTLTKKISKNKKLTLAQVTKKSIFRKKITKTFQTEYYDLPNNYDKTIVTILSQTPTTLFVYWEISEDTRNKFKETYGENFFAITTPILIVYNDTLNYSFEVEINDFANSWYLHINDSNCKYHIELGRKPLPTANQNPINNIYSEVESGSNKQIAYIPYYIYISSSNEMITPNNKMLFNFNPKTITFRNIKNGQIIEKNSQDFKFITNHGIFSICELYKNLYPNNDLIDENFFSGNPSSGFTSSRFSSQFK